MNKNNSSGKKNKLIANLLTGLQSLNLTVFLPPFLLLLTAVAYSLIDSAQFGVTTKWLNQQLVSRFGWAFSLCALSCFVTCVLVFFSDFAEVKLGGSSAEPLMSRWNWFSITICTTIAVGILFWATAEPLKHFNSPPRSTGLEPQSPEAAQFAMQAMFLHWTFTPYAIYAVASLTFAFVYYNMKLPFSFGLATYADSREMGRGLRGKLHRRDLSLFVGRWDGRIIGYWDIDNLRRTDAHFLAYRPTYLYGPVSRWRSSRLLLCRVFQA